VPTEEEREYFDLLVGLFEHASRGVEKVERRVSLSSDSARDYSAFLDVAGAVLAASTGSEERGASDERDEIGGLVRRLQGAAESFSRGETPSEGEARLLSHVLKAIAVFNARQASDFLLAPQPSF
jgi:hypothetical protein